MQRRYIHIESPEALSVQQDELRAPAAGELAIAVHFAGINRADLLQRLGLYPVPEDASPILGLEVAGGHRPGARRGGLRRGGPGRRPGTGWCYASAAIARADHSLLLPDTIGSREAAALPEALLTVWHNVFTLGRLAPGKHCWYTEAAAASAA